jgi:hypothetical protein
MSTNALVKGIESSLNGVFKVGKEEKKGDGRCGGVFLVVCVVGDGREWMEQMVGSSLLNGSAFLEDLNNPLFCPLS